MSQSNSSIFGGIFGVLVLVFGLGMLLQLFTGSNSPSTPTVPDKNSFEHRYATERFRQEGLSRSDAQKAADAVIRFNEAQKNRNR